MSTISVPLTPDLEKFIDKMISAGEASNKADVVRKALRRMSEEEAVNSILEAQREIREGKGLRGDLRKLAKELE